MSTTGSVSTTYDIECYKWQRKEIIDDSPSSTHRWVPIPEPISLTFDNNDSHSFFTGDIPEGIEQGDDVLAQWRDDNYEDAKWYSAHVDSINVDGTYKISFTSHFAPNSRSCDVPSFMIMKKQSHNTLISGRLKYRAFHLNSNDWKDGICYYESHPYDPSKDVFIILNPHNEVEELVRLRDCKIIGESIEDHDHFSVMGKIDSNTPITIELQTFDTNGNQRWMNAMQLSVNIDSETVTLMGNVTFYVIHSKKGGHEWTCRRRYNEFNSLKQKIVELGTPVTSMFPNKYTLSTTHNMSDRRNKLHTYLVEVVRLSNVDNGNNLRSLVDAFLKEERPSLNGKWTTPVEGGKPKSVTCEYDGRHLTVRDSNRVSTLENCTISQSTTNKAQCLIQGGW